MKTTTDRLVEDYLERLDAELHDLPRARRRELVEEIAEHIAEARAGLEAGTEAEMRTLLDRLGDPADIAADARERFGVGHRRRGLAETFALILLIGGGFLFVVGWFVGLVLLWVSAAWTTREKLVGTLLVPGGLLPAFLLLLAGGTGSGGACVTELDPVTGAEIDTFCTGGPSPGAQAFWLTVFAVCVVGPFFTTAFLARRLRRSAAAASA